MTCRAERSAYDSHADGTHLNSHHNARRAEGGVPRLAVAALAGGVLAATGTVTTALACTIGFTTEAVQAVAGLAVLFDSAWILLVALFLLRDPDLAREEGHQ